jgi:uncharacterized protein YceK
MADNAYNLYGVRMLKRLICVGIILFSFLLCSCGTLYTQVSPKQKFCNTPSPIPNIYSGTFLGFACLTQYDCYNINDICNPWRNSGNIAGLADVPLSLVFDTVILPITIYKQITYGNLCDEVPSEVVIPATTENNQDFPHQELVK